MPNDTERGNIFRLSADAASRCTAYWYDRVSAGGRDLALFGGDYRARCLDAVSSTLRGGEVLTLFPEFPLSGDPFLDLTAGDNTPGGTEPLSFLHGDGFGYQPVFDFNSARGVSSVMLEYDLSDGGPLFPHVIMEPESIIADGDYLGTVLELLGIPERYETFREKLRTAPEGYRPSFFGSFRGRSESPSRLAFTVDSETCAKYRREPGRFLNDLDRFGVPCLTEEMLGPAKILFDHSDAFTVDLDIPAQCGFCPSLGLEFGVNSTMKLSDYMPGKFMRSLFAEFLTDLEANGLIDSRWKTAAETAFAVNADPEANGQRLLMLHRFYSVKLRWKNGTAKAPKLYTQFICCPCRE